MSNPIITFGLRGAQILFSVVALGLSVSLLKGHKYGDLPATIGFSIFVTAVALLGAFVGIAANWVELLQGIIGAGIDGLVLLANIAGGIVSRTLIIKHVQAANPTSVNCVQDEGD